MQQQGIILIAEDNEDDYCLVELACRRAEIKLRLVRVPDGVAAREYLSGVGTYADRTQYPLPRMVLADLKMPRMNGLELLAWMRSQPPLRRIPFVILTASGLQSDINQAYDLHANSYLVKPINLEELTDLLRNVKSYWLEWNEEPTPATPH